MPKTLENRKERWPQVAFMAETYMNGLGRETREAKLRLACDHIAQQTGKRVKVRPQTLRTYLLAARFIEDVSRKYRSSGLREVLMAMPAIAVEVLARWHKYDPRRVLAGISQGEFQQLSVRSIFEAERRARLGAIEGRGDGRTGLSSRLTGIGYLGGLAHHVMSNCTCVWPPRSTLPERLPEGIAHDNDDFSDPTGKAYELWLGWEDGHVVRCAGLVAGPYSEPDRYRLRAADWCLRALGLTFLHERVLLYWPAAEGVSQLLGFLNAVPSQSARLRVVVDRDPASNESD